MKLNSFKMMKPVVFQSQLFPRQNLKTDYTTNFQPNTIHKPTKKIVTHTTLSAKIDLPLNENISDQVPSVPITIAPVPNDRTIRELEETVVEQLKTFMKQAENNFTSQKQDLVTLITETLNEKHSSLKSQIDSIAEHKVPPRYINDQFSYSDIPQQRVYQQPPQMQPLQNFNPQPQQPHTSLPPVSVVQPKQDQVVKQRGRYYPLTSTLWKNVRDLFPDLPESLLSSEYIKDNDKYIKIKNNYIKIDDMGVAKILNSINKTN
jgi:hypothetical protein